MRRRREEEETRGGGDAMRRRREEAHPFMEEGARMEGHRGRGQIALALFGEKH